MYVFFLQEIVEELFLQLHRTRHFCNKARKTIRLRMPGIAGRILLIHSAQPVFQQFALLLCSTHRQKIHAV